MPVRAYVRFYRVRLNQIGNLIFIFYALKRMMKTCIFWDVPPHSNRIIAILVGYPINFHFPTLNWGGSYIMIYVQPIPCQNHYLWNTGFLLPMDSNQSKRWTPNSMGQLIIFLRYTGRDAVGGRRPTPAAAPQSVHLGVGDCGGEELLCILKLWKGNGKRKPASVPCVRMDMELDGVHRVVQTVNALLIGFLNPSYPFFWNKTLASWLLSHPITKYARQRTKNTNI